MCAYRIEVTQKDDAPFFAFRGFGKIPEHVLNDQLTPSVWAGSTQWVCLINRNSGRVAVHCTRAGKHHLHTVQDRLCKAGVCV